jgi:hypothetical protein
VSGDPSRRHRDNQPVAAMIHKRGTVPYRTIVAASIMLIGVVMAGAGLFRDSQVLLMIGVFVTVGGIMVEIVSGSVLSSGKRRSGDQR